MIANAISQGLFRANALDFITGRYQGAYKAGQDGSARLTLPEILKGANIGESWQAQGYNSAGDIIMYNFKRNGAKMLTTVILTPIAFNVAKKVLRKPILTPANKMLKQVALPVRV